MPLLLEFQLLLKQQFLFALHLQLLDQLLDNVLLLLYCIVSIAEIRNGQVLKSNAKLRIAAEP